MKLYNKRDEKPPRSAVLIDRDTKWGNPFPLKNEADRENCLIKYINWLDLNPKLKEQMVRDLKDKDLVCWCAPLLCHGEIIMEIANHDPSLSSRW